MTLYVSRIDYYDPMSDELSFKKNDPELPVYHVYSDGSYRPLLNIGAASCIVTMGTEIVSSKSYVHDFKDSHCAEMYAALLGLRAIDHKSNIYLYVDSSVVEFACKISNNKKLFNRWINRCVFGRWYNYFALHEISRLIKIHNIKCILIKRNSLSLQKQCDKACRRAILEYQIKETQKTYFGIRDFINNDQYVALRSYGFSKPI